VIALRPADDFEVLAARLVIPGHSQPQGSKSAFVPPHPYRRSKTGACRGGRAVLREGSSHAAHDAWRAWRDHVEAAARRSDTRALDAPCAVTVTFYLPRPTSLPKRVLYPHRAADLDKLVRAALDGLVAGGLLTNDARVVDLCAYKRYTDERPCAVVGVFIA
jgi:Holliday junction resolvase RusA-like endonuclease